MTFELWSVNRVLRIFGIVLVVVISDDDAPTMLRLERSRAYDQRVGTHR